MMMKLIHRALRGRMEFEEERLFFCIVFFFFCIVSFFFIIIIVLFVILNIDFYGKEKRRI